MNKSTGWQKTALMALCIFLALILIVMLFATVYVNYLLSHINRVDPNKESTMSPSQAWNDMLTDPDMNTIDPTGDTYIPIEDITFPTDSSKPVRPDVYGDHLTNILLVGQDRRPGEGRQRSDTMILVSFNKSTGTITLTSFMRDQYVQIPGYMPNKLNAAYQYGGMSLLSETLLENFGVKVDGVVEVDFSGFEKVIDLVGGVDIKLTQKEVDYFKTAYGWNYVVGMNHMDGTQALAYARLRSIDTDYRRAERQRNVVSAVINAYKNQSLGQLVGMLDDILPLVTTNLSNSQILSMATDVFPMLSGAKMENVRIPLDGTFDSGNVEVRPGLANWFQYHIDFDANIDKLYEIFAPAD